MLTKKALPSNPVTTIFTPPVGCFDSLPSVWQSCIYSTCFWSRPSDCYPASPSLNFWVTFASDVPYNYTILYHYYPGALPSGLSVVSSSQIPPRGGNGALLGCPPNWYITTRNGTAEDFCHTSLYGTYVIEKTVTTTGQFIGVLPGVSIAWVSPDLSMFTPVSAPMLQWLYPSKIAAYEASVSATAAPRSTLRPTPSQTSSIVTTTAHSTHHHTTSAAATPVNNSSEQSSGLSTGFKAGIGAGCVLGAIAILLLVGFALLRRRKRSQRVELPEIQRGEWKPPSAEEAQRIRRTPLYEQTANINNTYSYVQAKPELAGKLESEDEMRSMPSPSPHGQADDQVRMQDGLRYSITNPDRFDDPIYFGELSAGSLRYNADLHRSPSDGSATLARSSDR